jgi:hypothetical protein
MDFFYGGIVSCLSAETTVGTNVGESVNWVGLSNTGEERFLNEYAKVLRNMETRNL